MLGLRNVDEQSRLIINLIHFSNTDTLEAAGLNSLKFEPSVIGNLCENDATTGMVQVVWHSGDK